MLGLISQLVTNKIKEFLVHCNVHDDLFPLQLGMKSVQLVMGVHGSHVLHNGVHPLRTVPHQLPPHHDSLGGLCGRKIIITIYNLITNYNYNLNLLREYKEKTGTGIIHFNNPHQLIDRLELLIGSINAGNNGVKQGFTQIAHLLHQLKVITKKQLNDLLKIYILNK